MSHWGAWFDYELGSLYLQLRECDLAAARLEQAAAFFSWIAAPETAYNPLPGQRYTALAYVTLARCCNDIGTAERLVDDYLARFPMKGVAPIYRSTMDFQRAEIARASGDWRGALKLYRGMRRGVEIHDGLSMLGVALCAWGAGRKVAPWLTRATATFDSRGSLFGLAYCSRLATRTGLDFAPTAFNRSDIEHVADGMFAREPWPAEPGSSVIWI